MARHTQQGASETSDLSLYITTDKILGTSPLLQTSSVHPRVPLDVVVINATTLATDPSAPLYDRVAQKITAGFEADSCTLVYGHDFDGEVWKGFVYKTISTGLNCDTAASCETFRTAVGECADRLHETRAVRGCCRISYGRTWFGHLRLTAEVDGWPLTYF